MDESGPLKPRGNPAPRDQDTSSSSHELQWSREQKWNRAQVSTVSILTSRKTQTAIPV